MSGFVWVSVRGPDLTAELAIPADLPLAEVLPDLVQGAGLLDAATACTGYRVETDAGSALLGGASLADQQVVDGAVLRVRPRLRDLPPSPYDGVLPVTRPRWFGRVSAWCREQRATGRSRARPGWETTRAG